MRERLASRCGNCRNIGSAQGLAVDNLLLNVCVALGDERDGERSFLPYRIQNNRRAVLRKVPFHDGAFGQLVASVLGNGAARRERPTSWRVPVVCKRIGIESRGKRVIRQVLLSHRAGRILGARAELDLVGKRDPLGIQVYGRAGARRNNKRQRAIGWIGNKRLDSCRVAVDNGAIGRCGPPGEAVSRYGHSRSHRQTQLGRIGGIHVAGHVGRTALSLADGGLVAMERDGVHVRCELRDIGQDQRPQLAVFDFGAIGGVGRNGLARVGIDPSYEAVTVFCHGHSLRNAGIPRSHAAECGTGNPGICNRRAAGVGQSAAGLRGICQLGSLLGPLSVEHDDCFVVIVEIVHQLTRAKRTACAIGVGCPANKTITWAIDATKRAAVGDLVIHAERRGGVVNRAFALVLVVTDSIGIGHEMGRERDGMVHAVPTCDILDAGRRANSDLPYGVLFVNNHVVYVIGPITNMIARGRRGYGALGIAGHGVDRLGLGAVRAIVHPHSARPFGPIGNHDVARQPLGLERNGNRVVIVVAGNVIQMRRRSDFQAVISKVIITVLVLVIPSTECIAVLNGFVDAVKQVVLIPASADAGNLGRTAVHVEADDEVLARLPDNVERLLEHAVAHLYDAGIVDVGAANPANAESIAHFENSLGGIGTRVRAGANADDVVSLAREVQGRYSQRGTGIVRLLLHAAGGIVVVDGVNDGCAALGHPDGVKVCDLTVNHLAIKRVSGVRNKYFTFGIRCEFAPAAIRLRIPPLQNVCFGVADMPLETRPMLVELGQFGELFVIGSELIGERTAAAFARGRAVAVVPEDGARMPVPVHCAHDNVRLVGIQGDEL